MADVERTKRARYSRGSEATDALLPGGKVSPASPTNDNVEEIEPRQMFKEMTMRRIIKESQPGAINKICFNDLDEYRSNIFAALGPYQVSIYDNGNTGAFRKEAYLDGTHIDIVMRWPGSPDEPCTACCWVQEEHGDSLLAVGLANGDILIISYSQSLVIARLEKHKSEVLSVTAFHDCPGLLASAARGDDEIVFWNVSGAGDWSIVTNCKVPKAAVLAPSPDSKTVAVGCLGGKVYTVPVPDPGNKATVRLAAWFVGKHHNTDIDSIGWLSADQIISKSKDGHVLVLDPGKEGKASILKELVKAKKGSLCDWCPFALSKCKRYMCVGNSTTTVLVYNINTGELDCTVRDRRLIETQIVACTFCQGTEQILITTDKGYIVRYEYIYPQRKRLLEARHAEIEAEFPPSDESSGDESSDDAQKQSKANGNEKTNNARKGNGKGNVNDNDKSNIEDDKVEDNPSKDNAHDSN